MNNIWWNGKDVIGFSFLLLLCGFWVLFIGLPLLFLALKRQVKSWRKRRKPQAK